MALHPTVLWAQRKDRLFLTFDLQDCKEPKISVCNDDSNKVGQIKFLGKAHSHATGPEEHVYSIELTLFGEIDADDVKQASTDRTVTLVIAKKEVGPYWPRLLKEKGRVPQYLKTDWSKWVDEDEVEEEKLGGAEDFGGFDMSQLQNFTNTLGGDTLEEDSENDEDIPPLEKAS